MRGRPPVTRARVIGYIKRAKPDTVAQIARALNIDRANVYRILRAIYGPDFCLRWHEGAKGGADAPRIGWRREGAERGLFRKFERPEF